MHRHLHNLLFALPLTFAVACDSDIELPDVEETAVEPAADELAAPARDPQAASVLATTFVARRRSSSTRCSSDRLALLSKTVRGPAP